MAHVICVLEEPDEETPTIQLSSSRVGLEAQPGSDMPIYEVDRVLTAPSPDVLFAAVAPTLAFDSFCRLVLCVGPGSLDACVGDLAAAERRGLAPRCLAWLGEVEMIRRMAAENVRAARAKLDEAVARRGPAAEEPAAEEPAAAAEEPPPVVVDVGGFSVADDDAPVSDEERALAETLDRLEAHLRACEEACGRMRRVVDAADADGGDEARSSLAQVEMIRRMAAENVRGAKAKLDEARARRAASLRSRALGEGALGIAVAFDLGVLSDDELQRHELTRPDDVPISFVRSLSI